MLKEGSKKYLENAKNYVIASILAHENGNSDKEKFDSLVQNIDACLKGENKQRRDSGRVTLNSFSFAGVHYFINHDGVTFTPWTSEQIKAIAAVKSENKEEYAQLIEKYNNCSQDMILHLFAEVVSNGLKTAAVVNFNYYFEIDMRMLFINGR